MRITGGTLLGRTLRAPTGRATRPTSDRVREALFNILGHHDWGEDVLNPLLGATVLDAFGGTGALALESLSRGAQQATIFDTDRDALRAANANVESLQLGNVCFVKQANALRPPMGRPCTLVFLDPPYRKGLVIPALQALATANWIAEGALLVIETAKGETSDPVLGVAPIIDRTYGDTTLTFARFTLGETISTA
jgi:16S rRNA (guanine966-N2)-methyltransferase